MEQGHQVEARGGFMGMSEGRERCWGEQKRDGMAEESNGNGGGEGRRVVLEQEQYAAEIGRWKGMPVLDRLVGG